ncbi:MAG: aspartate-semialdehyde dehydrogenase, partial [Candidatus Puniceispirillaceae bacterium]
MGYKVAVVGATGAVGREMLQTLAERNFPADKIYALASSKSVGKEVSYGEDQIVTIQALDKFDFATADIALFSAGGDTAKAYAPKAGAAGCVVIDNSSAFRMDSDVPLIVPEVNPDTIEGCLIKNNGRNIIANPNCSTAQLVVALKPLHDEFSVKRVVVSTYQAVSGAGRPAMDELFNQTRGIFVNDAVQPEIFTKQIAFNAIPHIDVFMEDGSTKEEW